MVVRNCVAKNEKGCGRIVTHSSKNTDWHYLIFEESSIEREGKVVGWNCPFLFQKEARRFLNDGVRQNRIEARKSEHHT